MYPRMGRNNFAKCRVLDCVLITGFAILIAKCAEFEVITNSTNEVISDSLINELKELYKNPSTIEIPLLKLLGTLNDTVCGADMLTFMAALKSQEKWTLSMIDSFGKPAAGIFYGAFHWFGSYQECVTVLAENNAPFTAHYCWITLDPLTGKSNNSVPISFKSGVCFPASCSADEVFYFVNYIYDLLPHTITTRAKIIGANCISQENNFWMDWKAVASLIFILMIVLFTFAGTCYDVMWYTPQVTAENLVKNFDDTDNDSPRARDRKFDDARSQIGVLGTLLMSFSAYSNCKKIFKLTASDSSLTSLYGLKVYSIVWIILGHMYSVSLRFLDDLAIMPIIEDQLSFQLILASQYTVDTLLTLSGCLLVYKFLHQYYNNNGKISWTSYYIQHYLRFTPLYLFVVLIFRGRIFKYMKQGPLWPDSGIDGDLCSKFWWRYPLYIQNFFSYEDLCMSYTWYFALEMQFYALAPVILFFLPKRLLVAVSSGISIVVLSWITTFTIAYNFNVSSFMDVKSMIGDSNKVAEMHEMVFIKPWCRINAYIIGMAMGWILYNSKISQVTLRKRFVCLGWAIAALCFVILLFGAYRNNFNTLTHALHNTFSRTFWSLVVCWIIFACCTGNGGIINHILSWPPVFPASRLSYASLLIHLSIPQFAVYTLEADIHYSIGITVTSFLTACAASYVVAVPLSLLFESPIISYQRLCRNKTERKRNGS